METTTKPSRKRKPSDKPALVHISLRLPKEVVDYFNTKYPFRKQAMIREVLADYVKKTLNN